MDTLVNYFENLVYLGKDIPDDFNKKTLMLNEREAVEKCADWVVNMLFNGREDLDNFIRSQGRYMVTTKDVEELMRKRNESVVRS